MNAPNTEYIQPFLKQQTFPTIFDMNVNWFWICVSACFFDSTMNIRDAGLLTEWYESMNIEHSRALYFIPVFVGVFECWELNSENIDITNSNRTDYFKLIYSTMYHVQCSVHPNLPYINPIRKLKFLLSLFIIVCRKLISVCSGILLPGGSMEQTNKKKEKHILSVICRTSNT